MEAILFQLVIMTCLKKWLKSAPILMAVVCGWPRKTLNYPPTFSVTCETNRTVSVENQYLGEVTILPVPSSGFMDITCDENIKHVSLLNQNGDVVQSVNGLDKNRIRLNTEEVPTGVYVVQLMLESGGVRTEQVIVSGN